MPRKFKKSKVSICVFCEGESEQAYIDFIKSEFHDVAVFKRPSSPGLFDDADNRFKKDPGYRNYVDASDEIWFFFDAEERPEDSSPFANDNRLHRVLVDATLQTARASFADGPG